MITCTKINKWYFEILYNAANKNGKLVTVGTVFGSPKHFLLLDKSSFK